MVGELREEPVRWTLVEQTKKKSQPPARFLLDRPFLTLLLYGRGFP